MSRSIPIIGWSTILVSIIIIFSELVSIFDNSMIHLLNTLFQAYPQAQNGMDSMMIMFQYQRLWSFYTIIYFLFILIGAFSFIRFRARGRLILEIACWVGMVNACVDSLLSYLLWENMQSAILAVTKNMGMGLGNLNPLGLFAIVAGFFLWIIPSIGMIVYLRSHKLRALMK